MLFTKSKSPKSVLLLILLMASVGQFASGIYLPSLPHIAAYFNTPYSTVQLSLMCYYLSYGIAQFVYGPLIDSFGHRKTALAGIFIFMLASFMAATAANIDVLLLACVCQGIGIAVSGVLVRSIPSKLYSGKQLIHVNSMANITLVVAPLMAPVWGGFLQQHFNWKACFVFLFVYSGFILILLFLKLPGSKAAKKHHKKSSIYHGYRLLLSKKQFVAYCTLGVIAYACIPPYEASAAFIFQNHYHFSPIQSGVLLLIPFLGYVIGSVILNMLNSRLAVKGILAVAMIIMGLSSVILLIETYYSSMTSFQFLLLITVFFIGPGILLPLSTSKVTEHLKQHVGKGAALFGGLQNIGGGLTTYLIAMTMKSSLIPLASILVFLTLLLTCCYVGFLNFNNKHCMRSVKS